MNPLENLKNEENKWPQHFIYSKTDVLIPYQVSIIYSLYQSTIHIDQIDFRMWNTSPAIESHWGWT